MTWLFLLRFVHLVAAATWLGGMIVLAALVLALRKAGAERALLQAAARAFAKVSWVAMAIAVGTGLGQVFVLNWPWSYPALHVKITVVVVAILLALGHQLTARKSSARARGVFQMLILIASFGIFAAAVAM